MSKVFIEESTLTAIGDAIRGKTGKSALIAPLNMANEIKSITTGGGGGGGNEPTAEDLTFSGALTYLFGNNNFKWVIDKYSKKIIFHNVNNSSNMFSGSYLLTDLSGLTIPFVSNANTSSMFNGCNALIKLPKVSGVINRNMNNLFSYCNKISSDEINKFFKDLTIPASNDGNTISGLFTNCCSVRDLTETLEWLHINVNTYTGSSTSFVVYTSTFNGCNTIDFLENIPVLYASTGAKTSNAFNSTFYACHRAKNITFKNNNGVPYEVKWKAQTIDLNGVGYTQNIGQVTQYGITADKEVKDDATYQALKNDPDWFTGDIAYSRYNHDSAVNTINSLPDTSAYLASAGGTNTIKFDGDSGRKTDGGAISTLTAEEIAVATAKGWTVSLI